MMTKQLRLFAWISTIGTSRPFAKVTLISFGHRRRVPSILTPKLLVIAIYNRLMHLYYVHLKSYSTSSPLLGLWRIHEGFSDNARSCSNTRSTCSHVLTATMVPLTGRTQTSGPTYLFSCIRVLHVIRACPCSTTAITQ